MWRATGRTTCAECARSRRIPSRTGRGSSARDCAEGGRSDEKGIDPEALLPYLYDRSLTRWHAPSRAVRACGELPFKMLKTLIEKGANVVNIRGGPYCTALQAACASRPSGLEMARRKEIVKLLLEKGADPNIQGGKSGRAYQALKGSDHSVLEMLKEKGAETCLRDGEEGRETVLSSQC
ncbi:hypothetical protein B0H15DRAFT_62309 [Mycena belliarum]|uniref:Uncharacterized protein n=1 Tax=Mycena belliarum TaxID=1033014 RepID=A0AAD6TSR1_9AGAR|nr:hypothetical protein B0H15DRAFT_62309 [Mycena belliae]